ncbi:MAG: AAA family ATPase [Candidatus Thermoplasmatota archaeon]|nr:AAA family ATPase [Candidatus Thermoplasmatota archaeon]MCL5963782.1 AAA family ATPase [Candidatus Thermoplasmatota archaeon]
MIIKKIILKNYRCYKDQVIEATKLNLDTTDNPGITLFTGDNSVGKTTIFNALGWVLYGKETQAILRRDPSTLPIPSTSSFDKDDSSEVKVELHMRDTGSVKEIILARTAIFKKGMMEPIDSEVTLFLTYSDNTDNYLSSRTDRDAVDRFLRQLFPSDIAPFHLFDGEFLESTYTNRGENIVKGIRDMFRIFRIEELREAAKEIEESYGRSRSKYTNNTKIKTCIEDQTRYEHNRDEISERLENLKTEIKSLEKVNSDLTEGIEKLGNVEAIKEKSERLKQIEEDIKAIENSVKDATKKKIQLILKNAYLLNSEDVFEEVSKIVGKLTERGKLPPEIKDTFVKDLLERKACICGTPLMVGSKSRNTLENLLKEIAGSSDMEVLQDMYYLGKTSIADIKTIRNQVEAENKNYVSYTNQKEPKEMERSKLTEELLGESSYEKIVSTYLELKQMRTSNETEIRNKILTQGNLEKNLQDEIDKISKIEKDIERFQEKDKEFQLYESYYQRVKKLHSIFSDLVGNIISEVAERYGKKVNEMIKMIPLLSRFTVKISVSATDDGKMDFEFLQDGNRKFYMAGGQNQLMGILLIAAFTKVMRESWPKDISAPFVVIDNPVSTLSQENIVLFGKILNDLFGGVHLILFIKNTDYDKILEGAGENISRFYKLSKGQNDDTTIVGEVKVNES